MNMKHSVIYTERHTFKKYDEGRIIGYLSEEVLPDYVPEDSVPDGSAGGEEPQPVTGYRYTGTEPDGGTIMPCQDPTDYGQVTNAIIRASLSESEELAIHRHYAGDKQTYAEEWQQYNELCENAKTQARMWLGI